MFNLTFLLINLLPCQKKVARCHGNSIEAFFIKESDPFVPLLYVVKFSFPFFFFLNRSQCGRKGLSAVVLLGREQ